jgi:FkbM family methyltransferase
MENKLQFYSQAGQDKWIFEIFNFNDNSPGYFLDIGAYDGVNASNSFLLEQLGWNGICVEPNLEEFNKLNQVRKCIKYNVAVNNYDGYCVFEGEGQGGAIIEDTNKQNNIRCLTVETILKQCKSPKIIEYVSIDVEGAEMKVLEKIPFNEYEIITMTVEHNAYANGPELRNEIYNFLTPLGYTCVHEATAPHFGQMVNFESWYMLTKYLPFGFSNFK